MGNYEELRKFELHCHTHYSRCSAQKPEQILKKCRKKNLDGLAITDHNTTKGYFETLKMARKTMKDFELIYSNEIKTQFGDVLVYYMNEEIKTRDFYEVCDKVKEQDALAVIAHPFRLRERLRFKRDIQEIRKKVHGIEVYNGRTYYLGNVKADIEAECLGLARTAGSDAHFSFEIGNCMTMCKDELRKSIRKKQTVLQYNPVRSFLTTLPGSLLSLKARTRSQ